MALEARLFGDHRAHQAQIPLTVHRLDRGDLRLAVLKGLQSLRLPVIGGVLGPDRVEAGDVPTEAVLTPAELVYLSGHVGRVDECQWLAPGCCDITVINV